MANVSQDYGFVPVDTLSGEIRKIECSKAAGLNEAHFVGDPVKLAGSGDTSGRPTVQIADAGDANIFGVIVGIKATGPDGLATLSSAASTAATLIVVPTLPGTVFRVNASNTTGARLDDIGLGFDHVATAGDTLTGRSNYALDVGEDASAGATTGRQWRVIGFDRRPDNEFSTTVTTDTADVDLLVVCAESFWHTGGAGT